MTAVRQAVVEKAKATSDVHKPLGDSDVDAADAGLYLQSVTAAAEISSPVCTSRYATRST